MKKPKRAPWSLKVRLRSVEPLPEKTLSPGDTLNLTDKGTGVPVLRIKYLGKDGIEVTQLAPYQPVVPSTWREWIDHVERERER